MKLWVIVLTLALLPALSHAITLEEAQAEADAWVGPRLSVIRDRVIACVQEGDPSICHTAWAASVTPNTDPVDASLATVTLDDPGRNADTVCGSCFTGEGTYAGAGIAIPATAPVNAKVNIFFPPDRVWSGQLVIEIQYNGTLYQRGYGGGGAPSFGWQEVVTIP
jgi:hypothetical protein